MTDRQERFARLVAQGKSQAEAFRETYPASRKWKEDAVWSNASNLARKVSARVEKLRRASDAATVMELREMRERLTQRIRDADNPDTKLPAADFVRLCDSLARISGWNAPEAVAVAAVVLTPEERARRMREALGLPQREVEA